MSTRLRDENDLITAAIAAHHALAPLFDKYKYARQEYISVNAAALHVTWAASQEDKRDALNAFDDATVAVREGHQAYKAAFSAATQGKAW